MNNSIYDILTQAYQMQEEYIMDLYLKDTPEGDNKETIQKEIKLLRQISELL